MTETERLIKNGVEVYPENIEDPNDEDYEGGCPMYEASKIRMKKMINEMDSRAAANINN